MHRGFGKILTWRCWGDSASSRLRLYRFTLCWFDHRIFGEVGRLQPRGEYGTERRDYCMHSMKTLRHASARLSPNLKFCPVCIHGWTCFRDDTTFVQSDTTYIDICIFKSDTQAWIHPILSPFLSTSPPVVIPLWGHISFSELLVSRVWTKCRPKHLLVTKLCFFLRR